MKISIFWLWIYVIIVLSTEQVDNFSIQNNAFKNFVITAAPNIPSKNFDFSICEKSCLNTVNNDFTVHTSLDTWTETNIPIKDDIIAIVYYKCDINEAHAKPRVNHTYFKFCKNMIEKCDKSSNKFQNRKFIDIKDANKPMLPIVLYIPQNQTSIKIETRKCMKDTMIYNFKINNKSIDYRKEEKVYGYTDNIFLSRNLNKVPILLEISKFQSNGTVFNIKFDIKRRKVQLCNHSNKVYCTYLCKDNKQKYKAKCKIKLKNQSIYVPTIQFGKGYCQSKPCQFMCVDIYYSYICVKLENDVYVETGYLEDKLEKDKYFGSRSFKKDNVPAEMVFVNECKRNKNICQSPRSCIDEDYGFRCANNDLNENECNNQEKNRFWHCPKVEVDEKIKLQLELIKNITSNETKSEEIITKLLDAFHNITTMKSGKNSSKISHKELINILLVIENYFTSMMDGEPDKMQLNNTESYAYYSRTINSTANEFVVPMNDDKQYVKLLLSNLDKDEEITAYYFRYKTIDILNSKEKIDKTNNDSKGKLKNTDSIAYCKTSDMISVLLKRETIDNKDKFRDNITIRFQLEDYYPLLSSENWLYKFEKNCGFLDTTEELGWSTEGCVSEKDRDDNMYCECNHLSNFAMLVSIVPINGIHLTIFQYLSIIGSIINCVSLLLFLVFVLCINSRDKLRLDQLNIALCLLCGTVLFMMGYITSKNENLCKLSAIITQFLLLAAFVWKLILGINVVRMIASLRYQNEDWMVKFRLAALGVGYGVPLFIVIISGSVYWGNYGIISENVCWINVKSKAFLTFIIPVGLILATNLIVLFFIANTLIRNYINTRRAKVNESNELMVFFQLVVSMGLTWVPSYFAIAYLSALYLWIIFFPLQGLMMFLFVVVINRENRQKVSDYVIQKYSSLINKSTSSTDTRSHSKSKATTNSKNYELSQGLLSENEKEKDRKKRKEGTNYQMKTLNNDDSLSEPLKNPIC